MTTTKDIKRAEDIHLLLFYKFMERGDAANAAEELEAINAHHETTQERNCLNSYVNLVDLIQSFKDENFIKCLQTIQKAREIAPMSCHLSQTEAKCLMSLKRYEEAEKIILKMPTDKAETFHLLGSVELYLKRHDNALLFLTHAHVLDPDNEDYRAERLEAEIRLESIDSTQKTYSPQQSYLWIDKCTYKFDMLRGRLFSDESDFHSAIVEFSAAIKVRTTTQALADRANCYFEVQNYENCVEDCERSLGLQLQQKSSRDMKNVKDLLLKATNCHQKDIIEHQKTMEIVKQCDKFDITTTSPTPTDNYATTSTRLEDSGFAEVEQHKSIEQPSDVTRALTLYNECDFTACFEKLTALKLKMNGAPAFPEKTFNKVIKIKNLLDECMLLLSMNFSLLFISHLQPYVYTMIYHNSIKRSQWLTKSSLWIEIIQTSATI